MLLMKIFTFLIPGINFKYLRMNECDGIFFIFETALFFLLWPGDCYVCGCGFVFFFVLL